MTNGSSSWGFQSVEWKKYFVQQVKCLDCLIWAVFSLDYDWKKCSYYLFSQNAHFNRYEKWWCPSWHYWSLYENGMIQIHSLPEEHSLVIMCVACLYALVFWDPLKMHHALQILLSSQCYTSVSSVIFLVKPPLYTLLYILKLWWKLKTEVWQYNFGCSTLLWPTMPYFL